MDERLISSCPTVYLKWKRCPPLVNSVISTFRAFLPWFEYFDDLIYCDRYDKLVIAAGSVSSTHGVPGLQHCFQLKTIGDAQGIRRRILGEFLASPNLSAPPI